MANVLALSDIQAPFHHLDTIDFLKTMKGQYKPHEVVCMGDEVDCHALGQWDSDPDGFSAGHELDAALAFMHELYKIFPKVKACTSNHTVRPLKRAFKAGIPKKFLKSYKEFMEAPKGWEWRDSWIIDEVKYEHGEGVSGQYGATKAAVQNMRSTVIGHIHSYAGIQYVACHDRLIFGMNTGCLIDKNAYAFAYGKTIRVKPILGTGIVLNGIPHFIPMMLDKYGRWTGKL